MEKVTSNDPFVRDTLGSLTIMEPYIPDGTRSPRLPEDAQNAKAVN